MSVLAGLMLAPVMAFEGQAVTESGSQYLEVHRYSACEARLCEQVDYLDSEGNMFASKTVTYQGLPWQPSFVFEDQRFDLTESITLDGEQIRVQRQIGDEQTRYTLDRSDDIVFDAGFHPFVQANYPALRAGETIRFRFLIPARDKPVDFQIKAVSQTSEQTTMKVRINNPVLAWFVDPIFLTYQNDGKTLLTFDGLTNIRRDDGEGNWHAEITYQY